MTLFEVLSVAVVAQGLLLVVMVATIKTSQRRASLFLAAYILLSTLSLMAHIAGQRNITLYAPLYGLFLLVVLKSPALYFYVRALSQPQFVIDRRVYRHFWLLLPGVLFSGLLLKIPVVDGNIEILADSQAVSTNWFALFMRFVVIAYALASLRILSSHRNFLENHFSRVEKINLNWLKYLICAVIFFELVRMGLYAAALLSGTQPSPIIVLVINATIIYCVAIGGLRQPIIFTRSLTSIIAQTTLPTDGLSVDKPALGKSGLQEAQLQPRWQALLSYVEHEQVYKDNALNLADLAQRSGIKPRDLSRLINSQFGGSFYEFINRYRVEAAQLLLADATQSHRKMLDIAMDVGFNSESTFYAHFKKHCGMTPKRYKQQCQAKY